MLLVDLNYNFEFDWFVELSYNKLSVNKLSNNKLSDNNMASELVGNRSFLNQLQLSKLQFLWLSDLSNGWCYPPFEQLGPDFKQIAMHCS